ncbi:MAG: acyltransferase [Rhizomicrobium sp.]
MRYHTLDAMRGVAAIAVVFLHLVLQFDLKPKPSSFMAVDFFFMLSGFVLATIYEDRLKRDLTPWKFLISRFVRLYPMYFLGMLIGTLTLLGQDIARSGHSMNLIQSISAILVGFLVIPDPLSSGLFPLNPPAWSLFYEGVINIVFAFAILHLRTRVLLILLLCFGVAYVSGAVAITQMSAGMAWNSIFLGLVRVTFPFGVGVLFARLRTKESISNSTLGVLLCCVLLLILLVPQFAFQPTIYNLLVTMVFLPALLWFGICWQMSGPTIIVAEALGDMSYPLYAIHYPLMRMSSFAARALHIPPLFFCIVFLIGSSFAALAIARYIDPPMRKFLGARISAIRACSRPAPALYT